MKIKVNLYYHLKEKAGTGNLYIELKDPATISDVKSTLEEKYPQLRTHLDNVMILMNQKIVLEEDPVVPDANVAFLTPVGGG